MVIIKRKTLYEYRRQYPESRKAIGDWTDKAEKADWNNLSEIRNSFHSVDYVGDNRYVFNIKGNQYRLIVMIFFSVRTIYIRWFGTHNEYDRIDVSKV